MKSFTQGDVDAYQDPSISGAKTPPDIGDIKRCFSVKTEERGKEGKNDDAPGTLVTSAAMIPIDLPVFINWLGIVGLIFGGCCSNVSYKRHQRLGRSSLT